jgi:23S rRNA (cytosine1962-C5)-methyltransferase
MIDAPRQVHLKPGRERSVRNRHPWIFTGAVAREKGDDESAIAEVFAASGERLGAGFYSRHSQIVVRLLTFGEERLTPELVADRIGRAVERRRQAFGSDTTACRLIHSEGDGLSGLIVDRYDDLLVVEITSAGLDRWRDAVVESLQRELAPRMIHLKNDLPARKLEKLPLQDEVAGEGAGEATVVENGLRFRVEPARGQKTGFFLDQRDNRQLIRSLAAGRSVLNLFSYSGAFGIYAMAGGASAVEDVDISAAATAAARTNYQLNDLAPSALVTADAFAHSRALQRDGRSFDLVVCDPPAFARSRGEVERAARGYKDINLQSLKLVAPGGYLATFSCSGHVSLDLFQKIVFSAALDAGREVSIVRRLSAGIDHPISIYCPESEYLKGFLLRVEN